jgi:hypothetical protein
MGQAARGKIHAALIQCHDDGRHLDDGVVQVGHLLVPAQHRAPQELALILPAS